MTSMSLADFFYDNKSMQHMVEHKLGITTVEELLFFTDSMIIKAPGLGASALTYINRRLKAEGLRLRRNHETVFQYALVEYGMIDNVPIVALNFTNDNRKDVHRVLKVVSAINEAHDKIVTFGQLENLLEFGHDDAMPQVDIDAFDAQCVVWGVSV